MTQADHSFAAQFIVLDGPEGCGKSTQTRLLAERIRKTGVEVIEARDPGATPIGEKVRQILLDRANIAMGMRCEMLLYMAARAQMMKEVIAPALEFGQAVVCDRFVSSTLAYQLGGDGLTAQQICNVADIAIDRRWPDITVILDISPAESFARVRRERDRIESRPIEYHQRVHQNYLAQAKENPATFRLVDARQSVEQVHESIWRAVGG